MLIKVTSKRQVTFPAAVLEALGAVPGSHLEIQPRADGFLLRARGIDRSKLAPLRSIIAKGTKPFDVKAFREQRHEPENRYSISKSAVFTTETQRTQRFGKMMRNTL
jgi:bifunctional DNA-binding transcriptional regulator/antitoxin component of YhaV-PrlF toxin-antitoxin module